MIKPFFALIFLSASQHLFAFTADDSEGRVNPTLPVKIQAFGRALPPMDQNAFEFKNTSISLADDNKALSQPADENTNIQAQETPQKTKEPEQEQTQPIINQGPTVIDFIASQSKFNTMVEALHAANLYSFLTSEGPFTIFAPSDEAFSKLPPGRVSELMSSEHKELLMTILGGHIIRGKFLPDQLSGDMKLETIIGTEMNIKVDGDELIINGNAKGLKTNMHEESNGVVYTIDEVL